MRSMITVLAKAMLGQEKPEDKPTPAELAAIAKLKEYGGLVLEIAQNDKRLDIGLHLANIKIKDEHLVPLKDLKNTAILNLRGTEITDAGLVNIAELKGLVRLGLEKTKITDKGLELLKGLENLESLNLYGTAVTDAGLVNLEGLKKLKKLYVWQTMVTDAGVAKLKEAIPMIDIVRGVDPPKPEVKAEEKKP